jgi:hypothetical protein
MLHFLFFLYWEPLVIAAVIIVATAVVAVAPTILGQALAKRTTTTCDIKGSTREGSCPGNSGSNDNPNQYQTSNTKAG